MNILPKKSWHVRNKDNVARVKKDEAEAAEGEREAQRRVERAEQEARTNFLRRKSRAALEEAGVKRPDDEEEEEKSGGSGGVLDGGVLEHLNLFPLEDSSGKKGNKEYLEEKKQETEKQERAIGLLVSLGPQPGTEVTPWYMKTGTEKEEDKAKEKKDKEKKDKEKDHGGKRKPMSAEEKEKKDRRLKDLLDPLKDMKKALAIKDKHKSKKKDRRDRGERTSSGESSMERLRAERSRREVEEKRRAQALLDQKNGKGKDKESGREAEERDRPYNNAYFPELARKRQRKDRDSWRDEILNS